MDHFLESPPRPSDGGVAVICFSRVDAARRLDSLEPWLEPEDHRRAAEAGLRGRTWLATRGVVRCALGRLLGRRIDFAHGPDGKPTAAGIAFNVSHSGDWAVLALAAEGALGVDLEAVNPGRPIERLARRFFDPDEQAAVAGHQASEQRAACFCTLWARKEAVMKAAGTGLVFPLAQCPVGNPRGPIDFRGGAWFISDIEAPSGFAAALAWDRPLGDGVAVWQLT